MYITLNCDYTATLYFTVNKSNHNKSINHAELDNHTLHYFSALCIIILINLVHYTSFIYHEITLSMQEKPV